MATDPLRDAEARLAILAEVSDRIGSVDDPAELLYEISRILGEHLAARRCLFTEIDLENDRGLVRRDYCRGVASVAGEYRVSDYAEVTRAAMTAGKIVVNADARIDPRTAAEWEKTYAPNGERSYVAVPLLREGRWVAELWISDDVPRAWSDQDVALLAAVAERAWTAVEKLRIHAALRESEGRMQFVGERAGVGYWYWDLRQGELNWSPVCCRLHGVAAGEEVSYERFLESVHPDDRERVDRDVRETLGRGVSSDYETEYRVLHPNGNVRWMHGRGSAMFEHGAPVRMAGITLDITPRKTLELEREELLANERRLRAEADEASLAKDHFLALLSHELRTPMTTILGWASFIRTGAADPATARRGIESIEQASRAQSRLIDELLDLSRIVTGKMLVDKKLHDLSAAVRGALEVTQPAAQAASITLTADLGGGPSFVEGDVTRLQQVVWNLVSNAVKFTPAGGHVDVSVVQDEQAVEIVVKDSGVGIDPEFLPYVFERFRQAEDGPSRRYGGLGLGLSIVRHLTELHGGTVHAFSEGLGKGAEFRVRLPRADERTAVRPTRQTRATSLSGVNVLLVDDDDQARNVLGTMLASFGASVTQAASAAEAWQHFADAPPDVLVSDLGMPGEDGYALIRRLRRAEWNVPAVAVTAYADPRDRDRALDAGFQAHLAKPVEPQELAAAVRSVLE
ncbi:MAG TPA: ATP-binding protein [Thermoanaerobaculia bacterium]|nr:ATP-binding protein [Thermoanaerobaculia bacterium]